MRSREIDITGGCQMDGKEKYRDFTIKTFMNSYKWDYLIPGITTKGYKGKRNLYNTKHEAISKAKEQIDYYLKS